MIDSGLLKGLPSETLLSLLPGFMQEVYDKGRIIKLSKGDVLHHQGQKLTKLFIPIDGDIVLFRKKGKKAKVLNFLEKGRSLGLSSILFDEEVDYSAKVDQETRIIEIDVADFVNFLGQHPTYRVYLEVISTSEAARSLKRFLTEYNLHPEKLINIISQIEDVKDTSPVGLNSLLQNHLLLLNDGKTLIEFPDKEFLTKELFEGAWMGGEALVPPSLLSYRIQSTTATRVQKVPHEVIRFAIESDLILERMYNEPFINLTSISDDYYLDFQSPKIDDSGIHLELFQNHFPHVAVDGFLKSKTDFENLVMTTINVCILKKLPYNYSLIENQFHKARKNLSMLEIAQIFEHFDILTRPFEGSLDNAVFPLVTFVENRLLVLYASQDEDVYFHDAGFGFGKMDLNDPRLAQATYLEIMTIEDHDLASNTTEELLDKYNVQKKKTPSRQNTEMLIFKRKRLLINILGVSFVIFLLGLATPYLSGKIIDEVLSLKDMTSMISYGAGLFLAFGFMTLLNYFKGNLIAEFSYLFDYDYSSFFYKKLLDLKQSFFDDINVGYVFARLGELNVIRQFFSIATLETLINFVVSIVYCFVLFGYGWKIALVPIVMFVIVFVLQVFFKRYIRKIHLKLFETDSKTSSLVSETISSMLTIKAFKAERYFSNKMDEWFLRTTRLTRDLSMTQSTFQALMGWIVKAVPIVAAWVAVVQVFRGNMTVGSIYAVVLYVNRTANPLNQIVEFFVEWEEIKISFQKLDDIFEGPPEETFDEKVSSLPVDLKGLIRLDRVRFRYHEDAPWVLENISFSIYPKQRVAIVGESGCGKTTLANLIAGTHRPTQGRILYDGVDQRYLSIESLRSQMGFIQQDNRLFSGSIKDNITYPFDVVQTEKMQDVAKRAYCDEFINVFPTGYDQFLSEGGMGLSGGQKQRLCIARTLYQDPKVLILDEATSALDADSEFKIMETLRLYLQSKTAIIIAHRYSTIRNCDQIIVMDQGKVVEVGTHEELIHKEGGKFFDLFKSQIIN